MDESKEDTLDAEVSETATGGAAAAAVVPSSETGPASRAESGSPDPASTPVKPEVVTVVPSAHVSEPSAVPESPAALPHPHSFHGPATSSVQVNPALLTLNQMAIVNASQNKLPCGDVKGLVKRLARHTLSSASKLGPWYKGDKYVDRSFYSWRNLQLFSDYQKQIYTPSGAVKGTYRK